MAALRVYRSWAASLMVCMLLGAGSCSAGGRLLQQVPRNPRTTGTAPGGGAVRGQGGGVPVMRPTTTGGGGGAAVGAGGMGGPPQRNTQMPQRQPEAGGVTRTPVTQAPGGGARLPEAGGTNVVTRTPTSQAPGGRLPEAGTTQQGATTGATNTPTLTPGGATTPARGTNPSSSGRTTGALATGAAVGALGGAAAGVAAGTALNAARDRTSDATNALNTPPTTTTTGSTGGATAPVSGTTTPATGTTTPATGGLTPRAAGSGPRPVAQGDVSGLTRLTGAVADLRNTAPRAIAPPTAPAAAEAFRGLTGAAVGGSSSAVRLLASAVTVSAAAAAGAVASAIALNNNNRDVGQTLYIVVNDNPTQAPQLLAYTAQQVVDNGQVAPFADTMSNSFAEAKRRNNIPAFTRAVADAINRGGNSARFAFSEAIARAYSQGGDAQAGVIEATAYALCSGGSTADAWGYAMAIALEKYPNACGAVQRANVLSAAQCASTLSFGGNAGYVMGFCGL